MKQDYFGTSKTEFNKAVKKAVHQSNIEQAKQMKQPKQEWWKKEYGVEHGKFYKLRPAWEISLEESFYNYCEDDLTSEQYSKVKQFISSLLLSQRKEVIREIIEEVNTTNIENNFGLDEDLVESIKILLITKINCAGNIVKYACRYDKKGTPKEDLEKIKVYVDILLERIK